MKVIFTFYYSPRKTKQTSKQTNEQTKQTNERVEMDGGPVAHCPATLGLL